jgi:hypothetical protein
MGYFFHIVKSELLYDTNIYFVDFTECSLLQFNVYFFDFIEYIFIAVHLLLHLISILNIFNILVMVILSKEIFIQQLIVLSFIFIATFLYLTYSIQSSP